MAAASDLRDELTCSICLNVFSDPVMLSCGHNFCRVCIGDVLDTQEGTGVYTCPECRAEFQECPALQQNRTLKNIAEHFLSIESKQGAEPAAIPCTYCDVPVPAVRTCAQCETSLCSKHLSKHSKAVEHVLIKPTSSLENRKCSVHKEILRYYCEQDAVCICASCCITGTHGGHQVETLSDAAEKIKAMLREECGALSSEKRELEVKISSLQAQSVSPGAGICRVNQMFSDIKDHLDTLKEHVESEIIRVRSDDSIKTVKMIQQMKLKKALLSSRMEDIEELSGSADPLSVLQGLKPGAEIHLDRVEDGRPPNDVDEVLSSVILHVHCKGLSDALADLRIKHGLDLPEATDILLDVNTAPEDVALSEDLKAASFTYPQKIPRPYKPERFQDRQVLSSAAFSSGRHFWEVETSAEHWIVGLSYPSIDRTHRGYPGPSTIGFNNKSWGLDFIDGYNGVNHDHQYKSISCSLEIQKVGLYLDYEAGRLSFYKLNHPITHVHTFTATFTEPLHLAILVSGEGCIRIIS